MARLSLNLSSKLTDIAAKNSQTRTALATVVSTPDAAGLCIIRISGGRTQTAKAKPGTAAYGDLVPVTFFPGSPLPVVSSSITATLVASESGALPVSIMHDIVPHDIAGEFHTGTIRNDQAPQFSLLDGSRPFTGPLQLAMGAQGTLVTGLNADLLDGMHASSFAVVEHNHTHAALLDLGADDHPHYLNVARHDIIDRHTLGTVVPHDSLVNLIEREHHNLTGLLNDDHPQYGAIAQTETITGTWTFQATMTARSILPELSDTYDLGSSTKLWRKGWLSELDAVLFSQNTQTLTAGWFSVVTDEGVLPGDVAAAATTVDFGKAMTVGDFVVLRAAGAVEYMLIGTLVSGTTYSVTRNLDGTGANDWPGGSVFAVRHDGSGWIELNAYDTPRLSLIRQGATYNAQSELVRIGDLNGMPGVAGSPWGIFVGDASQYLKYHDGTLTIAGNGAGLTSINGGNVTTSTITGDKINLSSYLSINSNTFGADGIQLQYNGGNPRAYIGDGANRFFKFDGTTIAWKAANTELDASGNLIASNATISGAITATSGSLGSLSVTGPLNVSSGAIYAGGSILTSNGINIYTNSSEAGGLKWGDSGIGTQAQIFTSYTSNVPTMNVICRPQFGTGYGIIDVRADGVTNGAPLPKARMVFDANAQTITVTNGTLVAPYFNADTVDGYHASQSVVANGIVTRDANGYIYTNYFNMSADLNTSTAQRIAIDAYNDGFLRWQTPTQFIANHGIRTRSSDALGCRAYSSTTQTLNNATITALSFNTQVNDTDNGFTPTTTRLYAQTAGYYIGGGSFSHNTGGNWYETYVYVRKNGAAYISCSSSAHNWNGTSVAETCTGMFYMAAGDYIEIMAYQNSGGAKTVNAADGSNQFHCLGWLMRVA